MQQSSTSIAGYLYHNYEVGESFYKGHWEKETRDIHKWRHTICKKKARIWPKRAKLTLLVYVSISPIDYFNALNNLSFVDAPA